MNDPVLLYGASAALACVLLLGALEKLKDLAGFSRAVAAYEILPSSLSGAFARGYALAEAAAGAMLLMPSLQAWGAALALLVLLVATLGLAYNLARSLVSRQRQVTSEQHQALDELEGAIRMVEKQIKYLTDFRKAGETMQSKGEEIAARAEKMRKDLEKQVTCMDEQLAALRAPEDGAGGEDE